MGRTSFLWSSTSFDPFSLYEYQPYVPYSSKMLLRKRRNILTTLLSLSPPLKTCFPCWYEVLLAPYGIGVIQLPQLETISVVKSQSEHLRFFRFFNFRSVMTGSPLTVFRFTEILLSLPVGLGSVWCMTRLEALYCE